MKSQGRKMSIQKERSLLNEQTNKNLNNAINSSNDGKNYVRDELCSSLEINNSTIKVSY